VLDCIANPWAPGVGRPEFVLGDRVLSRNGIDTGPDVVDLIRLLIELGFDLVPDGEFGPAVEAAVIDFQGRHGLPPDGFVRLDTVEAIKRALTLPATTDTETPVVARGQRAEAPLVPRTVRERRFRFGQANLQAQRFGGLDDSSPRRGKFLKDSMNCSIYALSEVSETARDAIRAVLGASRFKVFPVGLVCVMWDSTKWQHAGKKSVDFGTPIHGAVRVSLEDVRGSQLRVDVISMHVRPSAITDLAGKQADIKKAMTELHRAGVPTVVAGDFNTNTAFDIIEPFGFARSTRRVDTVNDPGEQRLDAVFTSPELLFRGKELLDPGSVSDHLAWVVRGTLTLG
ncbi:MAG: peptidoglycan-binding protein, partial [Micropruina sp.]